MARTRFHTRLQRLERQASMQQAEILYVWRLPDESAAEAFARCGVDSDDFPQVQVHVWHRGRGARLARPPAPLWVSKAPPDMTDLEHRLHEALQ